MGVRFIDLYKTIMLVVETPYYASLRNLKGMTAMETY